MKKRPSLLQATAPIFAILLLLGIGYGVFHLKIEPLLIIAVIVAAVLGKVLGVSWEEMQEGIVEKIAKSMSATLILITVGALIGTWMFSGTIPMMIFYGIELINPNYLFVTAFLVTALISTFTGTSWGSAGTVGVAIMGIAMVQGVSLPITAGAVVAGAFFGDKLSPLSDTTNLSPVVAGSNLYEHIRHLLYTTIPASLIGLVVYFIVGWSTYTSNAFDREKIEAMTSALTAMFHWNVLLIVPVLIVLVGSIKKYPTIPIMIISSITAIILGVVVQSMSLENAFLATVQGFNVSMVTAGGFDPAATPEAVQKLLNRGGMSSMMQTVLIAFCSFAFAGVISKIGCLEVVLEKLNEKVKSTGSLVLTTVLSCVIMAITTGSSYLAILIPGELFKDAYAQRGLHPKNLSRTLEDSGSIVVSLIPWSMAGVYMSSTLGVPVIEYLPWAIMCYLGFIIAIIYGYTGFTIEKINSSSNDKTANENIS
ncbi:MULTISPECIES: Na+/H+ antiporter NhaC [Bacillus cereus group]|uniref:Na+/H+ antiporter NhaC n=2 Tax=Bacillus TaxID=1386 RepID=UPI0001A0FC54|nr:MULTISPECIES: Na+/H+ antiporter NhaC [Bacillus cereus group]EEL47951.1 Na+/H+ antiporter NhaC [Bacillus cereus Rock3-44]PFO82740.1 Na+/H+ antiporter NhaC [Bacillus cereus]PGZ12572.1 Na+/H+ antiporter NhaC [Bacillus cereus]